MSDKVEIIEVGQFATLQNDNLIEHELAKGDIVYVAGDIFISTSEEDPYAMRRIFLGAKMDGDHIKATDGAFTIEGFSLKAVDEFTQARLDKQRTVDFEEK
ncbi:hypothetical protein D3C77_37950 [compost metagenome]